ncbi:hypothetical protein ABGB18_47055 [Nonomuraea sp. B12E4]|uniref:hypothetical protein n=1 Tax=Nonomuraea sp. B12E4 TaxID=3153564 RepID=UPI00325EEB20
MFLGCGDQQGARVLGIADGGLGAEAEHRSQVEWVRAVREGFFKLPIDAKTLERRSLAATA